jgi:hypothetical protein
VDDLLKRLPKLSPPKLPDLPTEPRSTEDLLDFLLAP